MEKIFAKENNLESVYNIVDGKFTYFKRFSGSKSKIARDIVRYEIEAEVKRLNLKLIKIRLFKYVVIIRYQGLN